MMGTKQVDSPNLDVKKQRVVKKARRTLLQNQFALINTHISNNAVVREMKPAGESRVEATDKGERTASMIDETQRISEDDEANRVADIISREVEPAGNANQVADVTDKIERVISMIDETLCISEDGGANQVADIIWREMESAGESRAEVTDKGERTASMIDETLRISEDGGASQVADIIWREMEPAGESRVEATDEVEQITSMIEQTLRISEDGGANQVADIIWRETEPAGESRVEATDKGERTASMIDETLKSLRSKLSASVGSEGTAKTYTFKQLQTVFNQDWRRTPLEDYATRLGYKSVRRLLKGDKVADIISREVGPDGKSQLRAKVTDKSERVISMIDQTQRINEGRRQAKQRESNQRAQTSQFRRTQ